MVSTSLAAQLSKGVSLNASLLADRSRRKHTESYLFTSREADQHDFPSVHALGVNGLSKLKTLDAKFGKYDDNLFSDAARGLDRTLQSEKQDAELDRTLGSFLRDLGPYLLEAPASKALEWIIRRFRVNEFNVDAVMALFLPYHETPHFAKMASILHVKESHLWSFLSPLKASGKPLPRSMLVEEMLSNVDVARFVVGLLPETLEAGQPYRTLIGFTASVTTEYLTRMEKVNEEVIAFFLPALIRNFALDSNQDCTLAGYTALATLSQRCQLSSKALMAVLAEMIKGQRHVKSQQFLPFLVAVVGPQDRLEDLSDLTTDSVIQIPGAVDSLTDCLQWVGAEQLILPLLPSLVRRASEATSGGILDSLLRSPSVPSSVVERSTELLFDVVLRSANQSDAAVLQLLAMIFQRYGDIFSETSSKLLETIAEENERRALESILRSVALPSSTTSGQGQWILSSNAVDAGSRVIAVRELLKALAVGDVDAEGRKDVYDALRARVSDTNTTVIETLYSDPETILPVLCDTEFIDSVSSALTASDVSRPIMRLHFAFVAEKLYGHSPELASFIFQRVYLPFILFTKPRQKTAAHVWQSLSDSKLAQYELLAGCTDIVSANPATEGSSRSVEEMMALNIAMTNRIAANVVASNAYPRHLDMLLHLLSSSDAHTANSCYLILRSLLSQLSGEHQVDAAQRILLSMGLQSLDVLHDVTANTTNLQDVISDETLLKSVVMKPSSSGTAHRLQVSVLALLPVVQRPVDAKIDWLGDRPSDSSDTRGKRFLELAHAIYALANSSSAAQCLSTSLLRALFVNLREQTLLFLGRVWTTSLLSDMDSITLPRAALFHAAAYLRAQVADVHHPQDFQVMLPCFLVALRSRQRAVRSAAVDCITIISQSAASAAVTPTVYALDSAYGNSSDDLQYLEWADFGRYVSSLDDRREHFINDGDYLDIFSQESLRKARSDSKKEVGYKLRILCYLLSHTVVWTSVHARVTLLKTLENVHHRTKLQMLLPLLQSLMPNNQTRLSGGWEDESLMMTYLQLLLGVFDETATPELTEPGSGSWATLIRFARFAFIDNTAPPSLRETIVRRLSSGLFSSLTVDLQREICIVLVESAAVSHHSQSMIKEAMGALLTDTELITSLLAHFQPAGTDSSHRASKRPKLNLDSERNLTDVSLRHMTVLVEILAAHKMPDSVELMSSALDALTRVCHSYASQSEAHYLMQLLMSMLESIALSIAGTATLAPNTVRMDILVELLRVTDNPQTFNQALLLIASLARLAPEFVMQNVMPVFTFMGTNVFHRDDSYSFRVVQKTIDSIVPVVISSFRTKHPASPGLQIASREFLHVFTDAATHIPRHRRTQFFNHLVEVLGRDEFLVSICLLLVDKVANRVVRQKPGDAARTLSLPLTILQSSFKEDPIKVIEQLLHEATRLLDRVMNPESSDQHAFLELSQDEDQTLPTSTRQMQAILIFVDLVLQHSSRKRTTINENAIQETVRLLLDLAELKQGPRRTPLELNELSRTALKALGHLLRVISAVEFTTAIDTILASSNSTAESGAMNLLASRLIIITPKSRQDISPTIISIIERICNRLKTSQETVIIQAGLKALRAIAQTAVGQEDPALTKALPLVLGVAANEKSLAEDTLACILPLSKKIGPRILPFFRDIVGFCSGVLLEFQANPDEDRSHLEQDAQVVLVALLSSMSQFWGVDELLQLSKLSLSDRPVFLTIRKTMAKQIPARQLLPALFRLWPELMTNDPYLRGSREVFFDLFKRVLRNAGRGDVHDYLRDIFKLFLEAFGMSSGRNRQDVEKFDNLTLTAFVDLVTKLNEAVFRPLFHRLFDWAFNTEEKNLDHQATFCRLLMALIKLLKGIITPYMGTVLGPIIDVLDSYRANRRQLWTLWISAVELLQTSLSHDEGVFWRADKLRQLIPTLVAQAEVCLSFKADDTRQALKSCLSALVAAMDDNSLLKSVNLELLMQTRSDDAQVRLFALECAENIWNEHSEKLSGFVSDVVTFIAECADDEHDEVAKAARRLKRTVENKCGSLDVLMQ